MENKELRKFGIMMGIAFLALTGIIYFKHKNIFLPTTVISGAFFAVGIVFPIVLKPLYIAWMKFAFILGWINTRLILIVLFFLVITPIGLLLKLLGKDLLDRKIDKKSPSYWWIEDRREFNPQDYEKQF